MRMGPPLLSDYKKAFAGKRLCQNLFGGPRFISVPFPYVLIQFFLFILPSLIIYGIEFIKIEGIRKVLIFGSTLFFLDVGISILTLFLKRERNVVRPRTRIKSQEQNLFAEEDTVVNEGVQAPSTWTFVAPNVAWGASHGFALVLSTASFSLSYPMLVNKETFILLRLFASFVLSTARFSAILSAPPEIAIFDTNQKRDVLYRPFYAGIVSLSYFLNWRFFSGDPDATPYLLSIILLPLGWGLGFLPPIAALVPWFIETALQELGGCPSFFYFESFLGLMLLLFYSIFVLIIGPHGTISVALQCAFGYLILLEISTTLFNSSVPRRFQVRERRQLFLTLVTFLGSVLTAAFTSQLHIMGAEMSGIVIGVTATGVTLIQLIQLNVSRNPPNKTKVWIHFVFRKILLIILHFCLTIEIAGETRNMDPNGVRSLYQLITILLNIRAYAYAVTHLKGSSIDLMLGALARLLYSNDEFPNQIGFTVLLFLISISRRSFERFFNHFISMSRIVNADFSSPLLDNKLKIFVFCIFGLPVSIGSLIIGSLIEGCPLSPVFTLPIFILTFPRPASFWMGKWFRRKKKALIGKRSLDEAVYATIFPSLVTEFVKKAKRAGIGLSPRDAFVARYEDRLIFIRILGIGLNFIYVSAKGLELQEQTSCHHQESAWMDEIFEKDISNQGSSFCLGFGKKILKHKFTVVEPLFQVEVPAYAESKSTIPYLLLSREKEILEKMFFIAFSYLWIKERSEIQGEAYWPYERIDINSQDQAHDSGNENSASNYEVEIGRIPSQNSAKPWSRVSSAKLSQDERRCWATVWIKKCVGNTIHPKIVKDKIENLTKQIWNFLEDCEEIQLHHYFEENFLMEEKVRLKSQGNESISEISSKAFRYASKLALDEIYLSDDCSSMTEDDAFDELSYYEKKLSFCTPSEIPSILRSITGSTNDLKTIVSMMPKEKGMSQMRIFTFDEAGLKFHIGRIDRGVLEGIWTNLSFELLYLTSDDEERFSIQHDRHLMRNLLTECADSPLGYPVYEETFRLDLFNNFKIEIV